MQKTRIILPLLFMALIFSNITFAKDFFIFDLEKNQILFMGENDTAFMEKAEVNKKPNFMIKTPYPEKYLAVIAPTISYEQKIFKKVINAEKSTAGQIILTNIATGRTEDVIDIGFPPFRWARTQDNKHFLITYQTALQSGRYELMHYNLENGKAEILKDINGEITDLSLSVNEKKLFMTIDKEADSKLLTLELSPLTLEKTTAIEKNAKGVFPLSDDRIALLHADEFKVGTMEPGVIKIVSLKDYSTVEQHGIKPYPTYFQWFEKERILVVASGLVRQGLFGLEGKGNFFKVTAQGIRFNENNHPWVDYHYSQKKDTLYVLFLKEMEIFDYKNGTTKRIKTGPNTFESGLLYFYQFHPLPDTAFMAIDCPYNGHFKFLDLEKNEIVSSVKYGRHRLFDGSKSVSAKASVAVSPDRQKYYILNQATSDLTILDNRFNKLNLLEPAEQLIGMYQVAKPNDNIILVTEKNVFRINCKDDSLQPVYQFTDPNKYAYLFEDNNRIIIITDREILVLSSSSLEVKSHFPLYGKPEDKYTRIKAGEQRYHFIRTL